MSVHVPALVHARCILMIPSSFNWNLYLLSPKHLSFGPLPRVFFDRPRKIHLWNCTCEMPQILIASDFFLFSKAVLIDFGVCIPEICPVLLIVQIRRAPFWSSCNSSRTCSLIRATTFLGNLFFGYLRWYYVKKTDRPFKGNNCSDVNSSDLGWFIVSSNYRIPHTLLLNYWVTKGGIKMFSPLLLG